MKVLAVLIIAVALVIAIVPQFTNCEANKDDSATMSTATASSTMASPSAMAGSATTTTAATTPIKKMKCYWTAHAEIITAVPLIAIGLLLLFARRKETTRALGILTAILGVLTILIPTSIIGTCLNDEMVCNTDMKPVLLIAGGIVVALGAAVLVFGEMSKGSGNGDGGPVTP